MSCIECVEEERSRQREIESVKIQLELLQLQMEMERWRVFKPVIEAVEELAYDGDIEENSEEEEMEIEDSNEEDQRKVTNDFPNREKINNNFTPEDINVAIMNTGGLKSKALSVSNMCNILDSTSATSFNQAKNVRNNSQGGQAAGGNETRNFGHPHGGSSGTGSMNYGPRPGLITQSSSGMQDPATSQNTAASHQLFTQPPPAIVPPFNRQVPGPYGGQGPYQHPQTPGANIGHVDTRGTGQGIPPSAAGWNNVSTASLDYQRMTTAANAQEMSRIQRQEHIRNELQNCQNLITAARFQPPGVIDLVKVYEKEAELRRQLNTM